MIRLACAGLALVSIAAARPRPVAATANPTSPPAR